MMTKSAMRIESTDGKFWCRLIDWLHKNPVESNSTTITLLGGSEPAWHAKPTGPGAWLSSGGNVRYLRDERDMELAAVICTGWFGPIPECDLETKGGA